MSHEEMIAQFVARNGVTKCPTTGSHSSNARSLRSLRDDVEQSLTDEPDVGECEEDDAADREAFGRARANGASVSDALDEMRTRSRE